jgi:LAS superfamily LD-carboxypeptidase LdcB
MSSALTADIHNLRDTVAESHNSLTSALTTEQQYVGNIQQQLGTVQSQVGNVTGTVSTMQKLAALDPQLLEKYSKVYFLNENYVPAHLSEIPFDYQYSNKSQLLFESDSLPFLERMISAASSSGVTLYVDSAYRSFDEQRALKGQYTMVYGAGTANSFSADQGYSEHQLGTAVDMITPGLGGALDDSFDGTKAFAWMQANAYKYGFELSYPKNNGYYVYEPWHWRFVGVKLATDLHNQGKNFYDLDQRVIDTYLATIFD